MIQRLTTLMLLLLVTLTGFGQADTTFTKADHYTTGKFDVAIFPAAYGALPPLLTETQMFTPTREEIDKAESALQSQLQALNKQMMNQSASPVIHKNLDKYKRQYFGYIDKNGNRVLFVNGFWSGDKELDEHWLKEIIMVFDGGSYYWSVKFDLGKKELFELYVNGYA